MVTTLIGVGGAGCRLISLAHDRIKGPNYVACDRNKTDLRPSKADTKVVYRDTPNLRKKFEKLLKNSEKVIVCAGLGGFGGAVAPSIANYAWLSGADVVSLVILPFKMETQRHAMAAFDLYDLKKSSKVIAVDQGKIAKLKPRFPMHKIMNLADEIVLQKIEKLAKSWTKHK